MAIDFSCACGRLLRVPDDAAGRQARCPACGQTTTVPGRTAPSRSALGKFLEEELASGPVAIPTASGGCPSCGKPLPPAAVVCIACGYDRRTKRQHETVVFGDEPRAEAGRPSRPRPSHGRSPTAGFDLLWLLFSFEGRIPRRVFWATTLALTVGFYAALFAVFAIVPPTKENVPLALVVVLPAAWSSLAVQSKRWHDRNKSGAWIFVGCIPVIGPLIAFIETGLLRGTVGRNDYGPDPT
jgi:uncharacterized membrane protein YhaH (DUF805 family)